MLYYKITGTVLNKNWHKVYNDKKEMEIISDRIRENAEVFNNDIDDYCFVENISKSTITIAAVIRSFSDVKSVVKDFINCIDMGVDVTKVEEVSLDTLRKMADRADRHDFIVDETILFDELKLDSICQRWGLRDFIQEKIIRPKKKEKIYELAHKCMSDETMIPELDRIYEKPNTTGMLAHPVHYMISTDDFDVMSNSLVTLISALYENRRVKSKRYSFTSFTGGRSDPSMHCTKTMFESSVGGTLVIEFVLPETEADVMSGEYDFIEDVCKLINRYRNKVLTILCFPKESKKSKGMALGCLRNMSFVEIEEDLVDEEKARAYLQEKAKQNKIRVDKKLYQKLEPDQKYYANELNDMFDLWYQLKMKNTVYSQYKDFDVVAKKQKAEKEKGSAYEELTAMIGLSEAKKIINKALNYYKAQKLFEDKGINNSDPAMHMVFTGNPGSAKTTVARLFARIMRENKVLARGHIVEVGRADLVGKFVGWTAPTIKKKFSEAKGGVLFIDEAYSLVDDRSGSYGDEAINTIVQEMENNREEVVVIFAGYPKKMEKFLDKNPGLRSRIAFHVPFDDYSTDELCDIAKLMAKKQDLTLTDDALEKMQEVFAVAREDEEFGNGRFVRNVLEDARMAQASRLVEMDFDEVKKKDVHTIIADDIEMPATIEKNQERVNIGFTS